MSAGAKIIAAVEEAIAGNFASVTVDGQRWVPEPKWQPIETAPKDGTKVLIWQGGIYAAWFETDYSWVPRGGWIDDYMRSDTYVYEPTHWLPLPPVPEAVE